MFLRHVPSSLCNSSSWSVGRLFTATVRISLSPTLLVLALMTGSGAGESLRAATVEERDQHFEAITALLDAEFRLSAERQRADFATQTYPDDAWFRKALEWYATVKAKAGTLEPSKIAALDAAASNLRAELDAAEETGKLPEPVARLLTGAGNLTVGIVRDLSGFLHPDEAPPVTPRAAERVAIAQGQVLALMAGADKEWRKTLAKVKANKAGDDLGLSGPEGDAKTIAALRQSTMLRFDAIKPVYFAYTGLREVVTRGREFGLDQTTVRAANDWLQAFLKENSAMVSDWEYNYGDYFPYLKAYANIILLEAARQEIPALKIDDLEGSLQAVTSLDAKQHIKAAADREDLIQLQVRCWTALLRTRLELATSESDKAKAAKHVEKGLEFFKQYKDGYKGQKDMTPSANDPYRANYIGQLWLMAARLHLAKGDNGAATSLLGEVASNKKINVAFFASGWLLKTSGGAAGGGGEWGKPTSPSEPAQALNIAKALRNEAKATLDDKVKRSQWLAAATQLRGGVLGLSTAYSDQFVEYGPEVYNLYATCLANLELRYHAALVAQEGLKAVAIRITKDANPWKKGAVWTESGKQVQLLAKNANSFSNALANRAKGGAVAAVQSDIIELVQKIVPELAGKSSEETLIANMISDGEWSRGIQASREFLKKYQTEQPKAYSWIVAAYSGWYDEGKKNKDEAKAKQVATDMQAATAVMEQEAKAELAKKLAPERARDWMRVLSTVQAAKLSSMMANEQYLDVLTTYNSEFWKNPPADEDLRARLLRGMCTAVNGAEAARIKDEKAKADPQSLLKAWPNYQSAYTIYKRYLPSIKDPLLLDKTQRFGKNMAGGMNTVVFLAEALSKQKDSPPELIEVLKLSRRAFADLYAPVIKETDKPNTIQFVADTLWTLDEHDRAVQLYEMFQKAIEADKDLQAFLAEPKPALDAVQDSLGSRPELTADWLKLRDLVEDKPGLADMVKQGEPAANYGELKRNFSDALLALQAFRTKAEGLKTKLGVDGWAKGDEAMKALSKLLIGAVQKVSVKGKLAQGYREIGNASKARELYSELYAYEPENPSYAAAYVDIVLDQVKADTATVKKEDIEKARRIAADIRNEADNNLDLFWQASVQVQELTLALGDAKKVNDALKFNSVNQSGPTSDLVQPAVLPDERQTGDDKRVRRARNALAIELANRYLALFKGNGVTVPVPMRLDQVVTADGKTVTLFVPADAPKFEAQVVTNQDDAEVTVFVEQGNSAIKAATPEPAVALPAPTPAPAPAPATTTTPVPEKKP